MTSDLRSIRLLGVALCGICLFSYHVFEFNSSIDIIMISDMRNWRNVEFHEEAHIVMPYAWAEYLI